MIGELDQLISLVNPEGTRTPDGIGGYAVAENVYATNIYAKVMPMKGRERDTTSTRQEGEANYLVKIRHRTGIQEGHAVRWGERLLNIVFVRDAGPRPLYLELECVLGKAI